MRSLLFCLLLFQLHLSLAAVYSKTLAKWCASDELIGDPMGLPSDQRYDTTSNICTQTFGIFDENKANSVCSKKAPFDVVATYDNVKGITCKWSSNVRCPNEDGIGIFDDCLEVIEKSKCKLPYNLTSLNRARKLILLLRNSGHQIVEVNVRDAAWTRRDVGFGKNGFTRSPQQGWKTAIVLSSEPMMKVTTGDIMTADTVGLNAPILCLIEPQDTTEEVVSKNVYQVAVKNGNVNDVDETRLHDICAKLCKNCFATYELPKTLSTAGQKIGVYLVPVRRKPDKKHKSYETCNPTNDRNQVKQYFVQKSQGKEEMANNNKWGTKQPSEQCADVPRSAVIQDKGKAGWSDVPPIVRACVVCTNDKSKILNPGIPDCGQNSHRKPSSNKCECQQGFTDIKQLPGFAKEKQLYDEGMFCALDCTQNSERQGITCVCTKGFIDIHSISASKYNSERQKYKKGQFCIKEVPCGQNTVVNYEKDRCDCESGYVKYDEDEAEKERRQNANLKAVDEKPYCVKQRTCLQNSELKQTGNACECLPNFVNVHDTEDLDKYTYDKRDGYCVPKAVCGPNSQITRKNTCNCDNGFVDILDSDASDTEKKKYERGTHCVPTPPPTPPPVKPAPKPEECKTTQLPIHVVLVVDSSGSINEELVLEADGNYVTYEAEEDNWNKYVLPFVADIGSLLNGDFTTLTFIKFSHLVEDPKQFKPKWTVEKWRKTILNEEHLKEYTMTHQALEDAYAVLNRDTTSKRKVVVLVSDGFPATHAKIVSTLHFTFDNQEKRKKNHPEIRVITVGMGTFLKQPARMYYRDVADPHDMLSDDMTGHEVMRLMASTPEDYVNVGEGFEALAKDLLANAIATSCA